jgi:protein-tyrosine phosphatase
MSPKQISVLYICMANICRSPAFEGALKHLAAKRGVEGNLYVDSCGLGWSHLGEPPDRRMFESAGKKGVLIDHRAQQFQDSFFDEFDYVFAVNRDIVEQLKLRAVRPEYLAKIKLATAYSARFRDEDVPDPYYEGRAGFDAVMEMALDAAEGFLAYAFG